MFQICGAHPVETLEEFNEKAAKIKEAMEKFQKVEEEALDVLELASRRKKQLQLEREAALAAAADAAARAEAYAKEEALKKLDIEAEETKRVEVEIPVLSSRTQNTPPINETVDNDAADADTILSFQKAAAAQKLLEDKKRKHLLAAERIKREQKLSRDAAMAVLYEREQTAMDNKREIQETKKMTKEDERSRHAASYFIECQIADMSAELAKERADELAGYRRYILILAFIINHKM